jgi:2-polyprenyl-3-methyl-5-hydroxy-6-metoxy-1,4-benzoquinol methylase
MQNIDKNIKFFDSIRPEGNFWASDLVFSRFVKLYSFVLESSKDLYSRNSVVLDAACGLGYGSSIIHTLYENVYGIDISDESIRYASSNYPNIYFRTVVSG